MVDVQAPAAGVGQTALFVAWVRQLESERPDALFRDPFAQAMLTALADDPVLAEVSAVIEQTHRSAKGFPEYFAVRTRFFDDRLQAAMDAGIRQVVTLAAGVDGRTLRLPCPEGTRWFELDLPEMTALKESLIERSGLELTVERHGVAADLTGKWRSALLDAGFDPGQPTAWLIEGLLMYLTDEAGDALLGEVAELSAPGSRLMLEHLKAAMLEEEGRPVRERVESQGATWLAARDDLQVWLARHGWQAEVFAGADPAIGHGRTVAPLPACWLAAAERAASEVYDTTAGTPDEAAAPGHDELVARATALREALWADADESDRQRRLTDRTIDGITESGLMRLMTPRQFGGHQSSMRTFLDVCTELAKGDCSAGWITGVLNAGNFVASVFPAAARHEVWGENPDARTALVLGAPRAVVEQDGEDAILVTGEWPYASGSLHAEWVSVLIPRGVDPEAPGVYLVLVPVGEVEIRDTWHFAGMRGTGSNTIVADRVRVPRHRTIPFMAMLSGDGDRLVDATHRYRDSLMGLFSIGLLGAMIGGAEAAYGFVREQGRNRMVAATTYPNQAASPSFQLDLAQVATMIDTAKLLAHRIADTVDACALAGEFPDLELRARNRMDSTQVAHQLREAIDLLMTAYGSSAFADGNPLQRIWRDVNVASRHAGFGMGVPQQLYGRALVGDDPRAISFLV